MARRIRITGTGIHGAAITPENPTGEYPVGFEFETDADLPAGWKGRAEIVGGEPAEGSVLVGNEDEDSEVGKARREIIEKAQAEIERITAEHATALQAETARADKAEAELKEANDKIAELTGKLAEPASPAEIVAAVGLLDAKSDAHWTDAGLPRVEAIAELTGKSVTRAAITEAAPDAKRPTE